VSPLAVVFDVVGTTDTALAGGDRPFHEIEYTWNFGDSGASGTNNWANGALLGVKNVATGPVAAHVFETTEGSGTQTFTVTVTANDGTNTNTKTVNIQVTDPASVFAGTATTCVSSSGTPVVGSGGCPSGAAVAQQTNFSSAISSYAGAGKRALFKRGDTWSASTSGTVGGTSAAGSIGAYGSGALPEIMSSANPVIAIGTSTDLRIMDLNVAGGGSAWGIDSNSVTLNKLTLLRLTMTGVGGGIVLSSIAANQNDQVAVVDSSVTLSTSAGGGMYSIYVAANHLALMGNSFTNQHAGEHVTRIPNTKVGIVSNNTLSNQAATKDLIKMHGDTGSGACQATGTGCVPTQYAVIQYNKLTNGADGSWPIGPAPQNAQLPEQLNDVIVERNWITNMGGTSGNNNNLAIFFSAVDGTVRNNLVNMTGAPIGDATGILVARRGIEQTPNRVRVYNNTIYTADAVTSGNFLAIGIGTATNVIVENNLGYAPSATSPSMLRASSGTTASHNTAEGSGAGSITSNPNFTAIPPTTIAGWKPICTGAYPCAQGMAVPVWSDFFKATEPATRDLGAVAH